MEQPDLVASIADSLSKLDVQLMSGDPADDSAQWQQIFAMRKHLDDQQRTLISATIKADDAGFKANAGLIEIATKQLNDAIKQQNQIDTIIKMASEISSDLDAILKQI